MAVERLNMAESTSSPDTSSNTPQVSPEQGVGAQQPGQINKAPDAQAGIPAGKLSFSSPDFDPKRTDYQAKEEGHYYVYTDPKTGEEVARIPSMAGGAEEDESNNTPIESPVPGLTGEDVQLFVNSGETVEGLNQLINSVGLQAFLQQAQPRLEFLRSQPVLTLEERAQQQAEERVKRIGQLQAERESLQSVSATSPREKTLLALSRFRINAELGNLGGGGDGGGGAERPGLTEGEPIPPDIDLEHEASPERGRQIAQAIQEQAALLYAGRLQEVDWPKLEQAYLDQRIHTEAVRLVKTRITPPHEAEVPTGGSREAIPEVNISIFQDLDETGEVRPFRPLGEWLQEYSDSVVEDGDRFKKEINVYFAEAARVGLLNDLNKKLAIAYREVKQGIQRKQTSDEIMFGSGRKPGVERGIEEVRNNMRRVYRNRIRTDAGIRRLVGVGELYAQMALDRFADVINNDDLEGVTQVDYIDNEFHLEQEETAGETFWHTTQGWYIEVYAQTEEEFEIAADSYVSTLQSITSDPKEILDQSQQFIRVLTQSDGSQKLLQTEEGKAFINRLTYRVQARVAIFGADDANERYQNDQYKAYMDYENKDDKGPDRYLELVKYLDGLPAGVLWAFDNDPRWEILFSLHGLRGELSDASPAQRDRSGSGLYNQLYELLTEEMLGVAIKNKKNLGNLSKFTSDKTFVSNFDGLFMYGKVPEGRANGDINIRAYQAALAQAPEGKLTTAQLRDKRVRLGKVQVELNGLRDRITNGENFTIKDGEGKDKPYDPLADSVFDLLENPADAKFYQNELARTRKAVDIALQIYGALGEKSKRGGGVFKTERKIDAEGKEFQYFVPVHMAEKFIQTGVTLIKIQYADDAEIWNGYDTWNDEIAKAIRAENIKNNQPELKNFKAQYRTAKVQESIKRNVAEFKKNGYEAILRNKDGSAMKIKRPKEDPKTGEVIKDANGKVVTEEVEADFYTATHHIYGNWSGHTYWSYQEEDRHMLLSDVTFAKARAIRDGKLRPQDADMWAEQLLILDPTLKRVRRFTKDFEDRERKLTMAAVEDSYQGHEAIGVALYEEFFPKYGTPAEEIGIYYGLQDFGGFRKTVEHARARAAEDPERFARRGRRMIPHIRIPISPLSEYLGQGARGALGAIMMMDAPVYKGAGALALNKFHAQAELAFKLSEALFITSKDEQGNIVEPLLLKLTNESDTNLQEFFQNLPENWWGSPSEQQKFCVAVRKSFARLERYEKLLSTMETMVRNASGAQLLENVDVLTDDGQLEIEVEKTFRALPDINKEDLTRAELDRFVQQAEEILRLSEDEYNAKFNKGVDDNDPGIDEGSISSDTGSGRHGARAFHYKFFEIFLDIGKRGGFRLYPTERFIYQHLKDKIVYTNPNVDGGVASTEDDIIDWLFGKFVPT